MTTALIAFSGGLDTSFLTRYCREAYGATRVITCTVNTGGFSSSEAEAIAARSKELGADLHIHRDAAQPYYDNVIKYLIFGNVSRDGYPLCVGSERMIIAEACIEVCKEFSADIFIHGSTGAGNDQYRFDVAAQVLGQGTIICRAPIREFSITRSFAAQYLQEGGIRISEKETNYSYNPGLWGVSIGGKETLRSDGLLPDDAWYSKPVSTINEMELILSFKKGTLDKLSYRGECISSPVAIIKRINVRN